MLLLDDIKQMAHGAGLSSSDLRVKQLAKAAYDLGMQHEREACLQIVDDFVDVPYLDTTIHAIRSRGKP